MERLRAFLTRALFGSSMMIDECSVVGFGIGSTLSQKWDDLDMHDLIATPNDQFYGWSPARKVKRGDGELFFARANFISKGGINFVCAFISAHLGLPKYSTTKVHSIYHPAGLVTRNGDRGRRARPLPPYSSKPV